MPLGIDLGLSKSAICSISRNKYKSILLKVPDKLKLKGNEKFNLLTLMYWVDERGPLIRAIKRAKIIIMEKPFGIKGNGKVLVEILGMTRLLAITYNKPYAIIAQTSLKKFATDFGHADKEELTHKAGQEFKFYAETDDEVDAFWLMKMGDCLLNPQNYKKWRRDSTKKIEIINQ